MTPPGGLGRPKPPALAPPAHLLPAGPADAGDGGHDPQATSAEQDALSQNRDALEQNKGLPFEKGIPSPPQALERSCLFSDFSVNMESRGSRTSAETPSQYTYIYTHKQWYKNIYIYI